MTGAVIKVHEPDREHVIATAHVVRAEYIKETDQTYIYFDDGSSVMVNGDETATVTGVMFEFYKAYVPKYQRGA